MNEETGWADRKFDFDFPIEKYPRILDRLRATPDRLEELIGFVPPSVLVHREGRTWSIQENAGHLGDVEALFIGRLEDYQAGAHTLRRADMTGRRTFEARHNETPIENVLGGFRRQREASVASLDTLAPEAFGKAALHPRLEKPMRLCDMLYFLAEHDDYHLSRIRELIAAHTPP
jgi:hypothetical protein